MEVEHTDNYYGLIRILKISNHWPSNINIEITNEISDRNVNVVHYHDSQQLIIWLPNYGNLYEYIQLNEEETSHIIWQKPISDLINGSVQILINTLEISPGNYFLLIKKLDELVHRIYFTKDPENKSIPDVKLADHQETSNSEMEDLEFWERFKQQTIDKVFRRVEFITEGRSGQVKYIEGPHTISFYMELGGGNCVFYLDIPEDKNWEAQTKMPLPRKKDIVEYVAQMTQIKQCPNCTYSIEENSIIYRKD